MVESNANIKKNNEDIIKIKCNTYNNILLTLEIFFITYGIIRLVNGITIKR